MSFKLNWNAIEKESFATYAKELLEEALNSGKRPTILSDDITIVDLNFGTVAPNFQILEIGDLGIDKFRGIFSFKYYGDASITVKTKISASLMKNYNNNLHEEFSFVKPNFILSDCDFDIPLNLKLSNIQLSSIIIIVFNKTKGLTLVFKNDPLENIDVNSTFDKITPIAEFLQKKIENQISDLFKEFLPSLLYKFSLKYTSQSFDQFHKDLLNKEMIEEDKKNKILLKDLEPENPFRISPASLMKTTRLASARQTLSLGNGIDRLSFDRFNKDLITKAFLNDVINRNKNYNPNKIELYEKDFTGDDVYSKIEYIKDFQNKMFTKNTSKPRRRVIKMKSKDSLRTEKQKDESVDRANHHVNIHAPFREELCDIDETNDIMSVPMSRPISKRGSMHHASRPESIMMSRNNTSTLSENDRKDRSRRASSTLLTREATKISSDEKSIAKNTVSQFQQPVHTASTNKFSEQNEIRRRILKLDKLVKEKHLNKRQHVLRQHARMHAPPIHPPPPYTL